MRTLTAVLVLTSIATAGERLIDARGYLLVQTQVNGKGPYLFLLDTGATSTVVVPEVAEAAGLAAEGQVSLTTSTGEHAASRVPAAEIRVGSAAARAEVLIDPLRAVRLLDRRIGGVLGQSFLSRFPCLIDYRHRRLWLGDEAAARGQALPELLVAQREGERMIIPAEAPGRRPVQLVLDSGAPALILYCGADCPNLETAGESRVDTDTGVSRGRQGMLASLEVGSLRIARPKTVVLDARPAGSREDGLLPAQWFSAVYLGPGNVVGLAR